MDEDEHDSSFLLQELDKPAVVLPTIDLFSPSRP
jgi:hypothetical protein